MLSLSISFSQLVLTLDLHFALSLGTASASRGSHSLSLCCIAVVSWIHWGLRRPSNRLDDHSLVFWFNPCIPSADLDRYVGLLQMLLRNPFVILLHPSVPTCCCLALERLVVQTGTSISLIHSHLRILDLDIYVHSQPHCSAFSTEYLAAAGPH